MVKLDQNSLYHQPNYIKEVVNAAQSIVPENETIFIALRGAFKEYLVCTENNVYIIKKGYMTGHVFGGGAFKMPYRNITNVEVSFGFGGGYFEVSAGGIQNTPKNYWSNDKKSDPAKQPNTISLTRADKESFTHASNLILERVALSHQSGTTQIFQQESPADQIRKYKALLDDGIITQEEFSKKKKELLGF